MNRNNGANGGYFVRPASSRPASSGSRMEAGRAKAFAEIRKAKGIEVWQMKQMPDNFAVIAEPYQFTS
jgi:hypothetical protein